MNNRQDFFRAISRVDDVRCELGEVSAALQILDDFMESEGAMTAETFEKWKAINFAKRFPLYLSTFRVIWRDLARAIDELYTATNELYAMIGVQNGPNVSEIEKKEKAVEELLDTV